MKPGDLALSKMANMQSQSPLKSPRLESLLNQHQPEAVSSSHHKKTTHFQQQRSGFEMPPLVISESGGTSRGGEEPHQPQPQQKRLSAPSTPGQDWRQATTNPIPATSTAGQNQKLLQVSHPTIQDYL